MKLKLHMIFIVIELLLKHECSIVYNVLQLTEGGDFTEKLT
jgi:hypothetical protein